jgi:hypothetical protein
MIPADSAWAAPSTPCAPAWRSSGTTMPTATPLLDTVRPSAIACTIDHREDPGPGRQHAVERHEQRAERQPDHRDPERPVHLRQPASGRAEHDQGQREQRDAEVGDPLVGAEVLVDDRPQRIERTDHHEQRSAERDGPGEGPDRSRSTARRRSAAPCSRPPARGRRTAAALRTRRRRRRTAPGSRTVRRAAPRSPGRVRSRTRRRRGAARGSGPGDWDRRGSRSVERPGRRHRSRSRR